MSRQAANFPVVVGFAISLLLHMVVIVPVMVMVMQSSGQMHRMAGRFDPEDLDEPQRKPPEEPQIELGIDAPTPSTLTWVGYEEYEEHLAALAEVEQAAFREVSASPHHPPTARPGLPTEQAPPAPQQVEEQSQRPAAEPSPAPPARTPIKTSDLAAMLAWVDRFLHEMPPASPSPPQTVEEPSPPDETITDDAGDIADKESQATSTIDVPLDQIRLGKPIARHGLELKPRQPKFTTLIVLTASPGNPLVEITFNRRGVPIAAIIVESSGDLRVDHAILSSLYRWRASGKAIDELDGDQTVSIRLRIILNRRR